MVFLGALVHYCSKLRDSGTHCQQSDGFPGTHGTHANGVPADSFYLSFTLFKVKITVEVIGNETLVHEH